LLGFFEKESTKKKKKRHHKFATSPKIFGQRRILLHFFENEVDSLNIIKGSKQGCVGFFSLKKIA
jgi:hypothetical protein